MFPSIHRVIPQTARAAAPPTALAPKTASYRRRTRNAANKAKIARTARWSPTANASRENASRIVPPCAAENGAATAITAAAIAKKVRAVAVRRIASGVVPVTGCVQAKSQRRRAGKTVANAPTAISMDKVAHAVMAHARRAFPNATTNAAARAMAAAAPARKVQAVAVRRRVRTGAALIKASARQRFLRRYAEKMGASVSTAPSRFPELPRVFVTTERAPAHPNARTNGAAIAMAAAVPARKVQAVAEKQHVPMAVAAPTESAGEVPINRTAATTVKPVKIVTMWEQEFGAKIKHAKHATLPVQVKCAAVTSTAADFNVTEMAVAAEATARGDVAPSTASAFQAPQIALVEIMGVGVKIARV